MAIESINPATGRRGPSFADLMEGELEEKFERARLAFATWSRLPLSSRAGVVAHAGEIFTREAEQLGRLATEEMGKLVEAARQEAEKCARGLRYYAENAEAFLRPEVITDPPGGSGPADARGEVHYEPLGAVLAVMP